MTIQTPPEDRREEVVEIEEPGYHERRAIVSDPVAAQRASLNRVNQFVWLLTVLLEALLAVRGLLSLFGANPGAAFAQLVYGVSDLFLAPFRGLFSNPTLGASTIELTTAVGMVAYAVAAWAVVQLLTVLFMRSYVTTGTVHRHIETRE